MNLILHRDPEVAAWAAQRLAREFVPPYVAVGTAGRDGVMDGAIVFNGYTGTDIEISGAGRGVVRRALWRWMARYVFDELHCPRASITVSADNAPMLTLADRIGFEREGVKRNGFGPGIDAVMFGMLPDACPWYERLH